MNKRIVIVICIVVALASFFGGVVYQYRDDMKLLEGGETAYSQLKEEYDALYKFPVDFVAIYKWIDHLVAVHQYFINNELYMDGYSKELHQEYIKLYVLIKTLFLIFEDEGVVRVP